MTYPRKRPTEAYQSTSLFEQGIGYVTIARFRLSGEVEVGVFLIDVYCLGIKDGFFTRTWEHEYEESFLDRVFAEEGRTALSPACARKLVQDAVDYAQGLGLAPHPDYRLAARVFGGIDTKACDRSFTFGKDGKPLFIQGPNESPSQVRHILHQLNTRCGEGNYHYIVLGDERGPWPIPGGRMIIGPAPD